MNVRVKVYGFIAVALVLAAAGYFAVPYFRSSPAEASSTEKSGPDQSPAQDSQVPVETALATRGEISAYLGSTTNLRPLREVDVASRSDGVIQSLQVEEGDHVRSGQLLCRLDDSLLQIQLQTIQQRLAQARLQLEKARIRQEKAAVQINNTREDYERYRKLYDEKLVSDREVSLLRYRLEELEHDGRVSTSESRELTHRVEELEAEIAQTQLEISRTQVQAPFTGYITQRLVNLGQTVRSMDALFKLSDFSPLFADVHLPELVAGRIRRGQPALIRLGTGEQGQVRGHVERISPVVDQTSGTVKVTVELEQSAPGFRPGAFVRVDIQTDTHHDAVLIPKRALIEEDGAQFLVTVENGIARRVPVRLGYQGDQQVEVLEGLPAGARVVVAGQGGLKEGAQVKEIAGRE